MNVVPLALMTSVMGHRINSVVFVVVLSEPVNFQLNVSPSKEMEDHTRHRKISFNSVEQRLIKLGICGFNSRQDGRVFSLPCVFFHFITRVNAQ